MARIHTDERPTAGRLVEKELSYGIVGCFYETYNELGGYGHSESTYTNALAIALTDKGFAVQREHIVDVYFRGQWVGHHRLDLLVEGRVILEIKATEALSDIHKKQVITYLTATGLQLGILLHFGPSAEYHRILGRSPIREHSVNSSNS